MSGSNGTIAQRRITGGSGEEYKLAQSSNTANTGETSTASDHTHTFTTAAEGTHGHTINAAGTSGNATNANLPPYYALAFIMRTT
mgnify:FL=1